MNKKNILLLSIFISITQFISGCGTSSSSAKEELDTSADGNNAILFVFGSDYASGELHWMNTKDSAFSSNSLSFYQDSKIISNDKYLFVLGRESGAENITVIDASKIQDESEAVIEQHILEAGSNPCDLVFIEDSTAWLSLYNSKNLIKINPFTGKTLKTIDNSKFASEGAIGPNACNLAITGDTLIVLMQRWSGSYTLPSNGLIALYNIESGNLLDTIALNTKNPQGMVLHNGSLYVATAGEYNAEYNFDADSLRGLEKVNLSEKTTTLVATGKDFGGGLYGNITLDSEKELIYVATYISYGKISLSAYNIEKGTINTIKGISNAEGSIIFDEEEKTLYIGDRTYNSEKTYKYSEGKLSSIKGDKALAPYSIAIARW